MKISIIHIKLLMKLTKISIKKQLINIKSYNKKLFVLNKNSFFLEKKKKKYKKKFKKNIILGLSSLEMHNFLRFIEIIEKKYNILIKESKKIKKKLDVFYINYNHLCSKLRLYRIIKSNINNKNKIKIFLQEERNREEIQTKNFFIKNNF